MAIEIFYDMKEVDKDSHHLTIHENNWMTSALSVFDALCGRYLCVEMWIDEVQVRKYDNR